MKTKPILFSTPMVQATLNGTKTQTRRVIKPIPLSLDHGKVNYKGRELTLNSLSNQAKYQKRDILWVRETFLLSEFLEHDGKYEYRADLQDYDAIWNKGIWKPSIFMPKEACRLWLKVTDVRAERLLDISESDAKAEGIEDVRKQNGYNFEIFRDYFGDMDGWRNPIYSFKSLWQSINGQDSWNANPYVWVYKYERCEMPKNFLS